MTRDILAELASESISEEDAEQIYDDLMASGVPSVPERLGLSRVEWTAFAHGVSLPELATWRTSGWPGSCAVCGQMIDVPKFGWMAKEVGEYHALVHISCLD